MGRAKRLALALSVTLLGCGSSSGDSPGSSSITGDGGRCLLFCISSSSQVGGGDDASVGTPDDGGFGGPDSSFDPDAYVENPDAAANAQAAATYAQADCQKNATCQGSPYGYPSLATCIQRETLALLDYLEAPGTSESPAFQLGCAAAIKAETCEQYFDTTVPGCQRTYGYLPPGAPCEYGIQCGSGYYCATSSTSNCGTCELVPPSDAGAGAPLGTIGSPCQQLSDCQFGLGCSGGSSTTSGTCVQGVIGTSCNTASYYWPCQYDTYCSSTTARCTQSPVAGPGATCGWVNLNETQYTECWAGGCNNSGYTTSTCPTLAQDGQPCSSTALCLFPASCSADGICVRTQAATCQ
jgi:hypothetical protein